MLPGTLRERRRACRRSHHHPRPRPLSPFRPRRSPHRIVLAETRAPRPAGRASKPTANSRPTTKASQVSPPRGQGDRRQIPTSKGLAYGAPAPGGHCGMALIRDSRYRRKAEHSVLPRAAPGLVCAANIRRLRNDHHNLPPPPGHGLRTNKVMLLLLVCESSLYGCSSCRYCCLLPCATPLPDISAHPPRIETAAGGRRPGSGGPGMLGNGGSLSPSMSLSLHLSLFAPCESPTAPASRSRCYTYLLAYRFIPSSGRGPQPRVCFCPAPQSGRCWWCWSMGGPDGARPRDRLLCGCMTSGRAHGG